MKKGYSLVIVLISILTILSACSATKKSVQINDTLDLSRVSVKLKIQAAYMTNIFGIYGKVENSTGITIPGHVEKGKLSENSEIFFVDDNGKVLYADKLFKIEIVLKYSGSEFESKRQSFAENGDDVLLYLKYDEEDVDANNYKYADIVDVLRKCNYAVLK